MSWVEPGLESIPAILISSRVELWNGIGLIAIVCEQVENTLTRSFPLVCFQCNEFRKVSTRCLVSWLESKPELTRRLVRTYNSLAGELTWLEVLVELARAKMVKTELTRKFARSHVFMVTSRKVELGHFC